MPAGVSGASGEGGNSSTSISSNISNPEQMAQIYEGEWKNDKRHGYGAIKCMGSYTYYGQWENNSRTGYGVLAHENGTKEEGQWQSGQLIVALKRRKINLKSHQLESKVQGAYTQAVQAADAARNKALLAESRATSAMAKSKMAQVVAMRAERDASMAREKAEEYKNAPRISGELYCGFSLFVCVFLFFNFFCVCVFVWRLKMGGGLKIMARCEEVDLMDG